MFFFSSTDFQIYAWFLNIIIFILTFHWMCLSLSFFHLFTFSSISTLILKERAYFTYVNPFLSVSTLHYYKVRINELVFWIPDNCLYIPHSIVLCYRLKWNIAVQEKKNVRVTSPGLTLSHCNFISLFNYRTYSNNNHNFVYIINRLSFFFFFSFLSVT